jgi:hypothetical protein
MNTEPRAALAEHPVARMARTYCSNATLIGRPFPRAVINVRQNLVQQKKGQGEEGRRRCRGNQHIGVSESDC